MLTRTIPQSQEPLPVVGFGTWQTFDIGTDRSQFEQRREVLAVLFEAGGKVIDSSPMYGRAEAVVGQLLSEMQAQAKAFLATKVWTSGEAAGRRQMEASFANLKTPSIDSLAAILRHERLDFVQLGYSLNVRAAEARLLPTAAERGVAVIVNQPFDSGSLFAQVRGKALPAWAAEVDCASWGQFFLKYILGHPAVTCVIPGTAKPEHARDNVAAGMGRLPDAAQRQRMSAYWEAGLP